MKRLFLTAAIMAAAASAASAQSSEGVTCQGTVTDRDGRPLSGAIISYRGTSTVGVTDNEGNFKITVPSSVSTLNIFYPGLVSKSVNVTDDMSNISLTTRSWSSQIRATGSIQTEFLIPQEDEAINTGKYEKDVLNNTYFDLTINAPYVSVGGRFQWTKWPLPGYDTDFAGWGVPYIWATGRYKWAQLTVGDYYEQFGSGLILRTYQERSLGVDNALRGGRIKLNPSPGVYFTGLAGKQRRYWERNSSWIWGADAEWSLDESFRKAFGQDYGLMLGFSYVGKHEKDETILVQPALDSRLHLPRNTAAFDARAKVRLHDFSILAEVATKNNDPSADNNYTYRRGSAVLLSGSYSSRGFSALVQAKRSDNMSFRSKRSEVGISSYVNHLPAFTLTQTYALAAMYPYATQPDGEWALQAELSYLFKKGTPIGGKYGTTVHLAGSYITALDRNVPEGSDPHKPAMGTNQYGAPFWKMGSLNYADINFDISKKFNRKLSFTLFYLFQKYNQEVVEGHGVNGAMVTANIFILEGQWKMAKRTQLRWELQYLTTKQDEGDWLSGLVELSLAPHWMFTFSDTYNAGATNINYYNALVTYNYKANRFTFGYGRTRAGYNCSGGVCRWVPATKGFQVSYNYTF